MSDTSHSAIDFVMSRLKPIDVLAALKKDLKIFLIIALILTLMGGLVGKSTVRTTSSAQLALSPLPIFGKGQIKNADGKISSDDLEAVLATPLDAKSTSLLCMSDEVLQKTLERVNQNGSLSKPIKNLKQLRKMLEFSVTVSKETPYDINYAPLVVLTAESSKSSDAKLIVNEWSHVCVEAAKRFQDALQNPVAKAMEERKADLKDNLTRAEMESEQFWTENNVQYLESRLNDISAKINTFRRTQDDMNADIAFDNGTIEVLEAEKANIPEKIELDWKASNELISTLGSKFGVTLKKEEGAANSGEAPLKVEVLNQVYWNIVGQLASAKASAEAKRKKLAELKTLVDQLEEERLKVQVDFAKATTGKVRVGREMIRLEEEFRDIAKKQEFAHVASSMNHPVMQVISEGEEWPVTGNGRGLIVGVFLGMVGFFTSACCSVALRFLLLPMFKG
jgi:hypothetical protein